VSVDVSGLRWTLAAAISAVLPLALVLPANTRLLLAACFSLGAISILRAHPLPRWLVAILALSALAAVLWLFGLGFGIRGFGRDAGSALLATMLGMKLLEVRGLRDARSVVVFGLFALMASFLQDQGPRTLLLALASGIVALATLAKLAELESPVGENPFFAAQDRVPGRLLSATRLLGLSLPLAIVAFLLFPRLAAPLWGLPQNMSEARTGLSEHMSPGDISRLYIDDTPVMRVTFDGPIPPPQQRYFRGPVLVNFDGRRWTRGYSSNVDPGILEPTAPRIAYELEQEPTERRYLFALDMPTQLPAGATFSHERSVRVRDPLNSLTRSRFESALDYRFEARLSSLLRNVFLAVPDDFNPKSLELARQWGAQLGGPEAVIQEALLLFNQQFTYTLEPPLLGRDSVDDFMFSTRSGYCEHFASAFVVLMRGAGIPARVVTGYQGGVVNPMGEYLVVRQSDAHAWAEVWLDGRGWVRIDPTNAVSPERIEQGSRSLLPESQWQPLRQPLLNALDWMRRGWNDLVLGYGAAQQSTLLRPIGIQNATWRELTSALAVAGGLALALTLILLLRLPQDRRSRVERAWEVFLQRCARYGIKKPVHQGPREFGHHLETRLPGWAGPLCERYSRWQFAERPDDHQVAERQLERDLRRARPPKKSV